jgi:hypothetical protein
LLAAPTLTVTARQDAAVGNKDAWPSVEISPRGTFAVLEPFSILSAGLTVLQWNRPRVLAKDEVRRLLAAIDDLPEPLATPTLIVTSAQLYYGP